METLTPTSRLNRINKSLLLAGALLLTASLLINYYSVHLKTLSSIRNSIQENIQRQERDFDALTRQGALLKKLADQTFDEKDLNELTGKEYGVFIYEPDQYGLVRLKFWNTPTTIPTQDIILSEKKNGMVVLQNGEFEYVRHEVSVAAGKKLLVLALIPIHTRYFMQNLYLKTDFVDNDGAEKRVMISADSTGAPVKSSYKNLLFYLKARTSHEEPILLSSFFLVGCVFCMLAILNNIAISISRRHNPWKGSMFLLLVVLALRAAAYFFPHLLHFKQYPLFDPTIYASGYVLPSLGDLLINTLLSCWVIIFFRQQTAHLTFRYRGSEWARWILIVLTVFVLVAVTFGAADITRSLITDGKGIAFSVTNFFSLSIYSLVSFIILTGISFTYFFLAEVILKTLIMLLGDNKSYIYLLTAIAGLLMLTFLQGYDPFVLSCFTLIWLLTYIWLIQKKVFAGLFTRLNVSAVLFWIFVYALSVSMIIFSENRKIEREQLSRTAVKLSSQNSGTEELILSVSFSTFDNDVLMTEFSRFRDSVSNAELKDSMTSRSFSLNASEFQTNIYTFDDKERALYNKDSTSFNTLNSVYEIDGNLTSVQDVRYFEQGYDQYAYICKKTVGDSVGKPAGYFFLLWYPKQYQKGELVPELFREESHLPDYSLEYSYAVYDSLELQHHFNNYEFPAFLTRKEKPASSMVQRKNGYDLLWFLEDNNKIVVFAKKNSSLLEFVTLFAYLVSTFIILASLYRLIILLVHSRLRLSNLKQYWQFNIRSQIYITIIFISLFSFLVIGIATVVFFYDRYDRNNYENLSSVIQIMTNDIQKKIRGQSALNEMVASYQSGSDNQLQKLLNDVAEIHGTDFNLYDTEGNLIVPSNPFIYSKGILSTKMNPIAFYHINYEHLIQYMHQEKLGDLDYKSIYAPVKDESGSTYAYLNMPSFVSQNELKKEISNFLITIINLNAFIFLVAGVIALFITHRLTSSFLLIGHKMREINLGKLNEEIKWHRDDEIGGLVKEYNKMVIKLEESARALAKSEREGAWREMARQVAHEIKNPLTPMKLSIQYLQKAINNNSPNVKDLSANVAHTLIEQIDHLSKIAADFSQFANIGNVKTEVFDLHEILNSLGSLYEATENMHFSWHPAHEQVFVEADRTQLNRLFTNLFQNALEACYSKEYCQLSVTEEISDENVVVKISDNGDGIPEAMKKKIFTPNFTTKSSGTGLGLAMSKSIIEQVHGRIWFETEEGMGTTFLVEIPIFQSHN